MLQRKLHMASLMLILVLPGCMGVPAEKMESPVYLDQGYNALSAADAPSVQPVLLAEAQWWKLYHDEMLNGLMVQAFAHNPDINQIRARLAQSQALAKQSNAALLPTLDVTGERSTSNGDNATPSDFSLTGAAAFELDLWGKNRATRNENALEAKASAEDFYSAAITLSASIVESWLDLLSLQEQKTLLLKQIDVNRTVLELQRKRFEMGASSALDILQQEEILASSQSELPDILSAQKQAANAIALLIGKTQYSDLKTKEKILPSPLPIPHTGIPSALLENRPDIVAAWLRLRSAHWAEKAAWANRLPRFDLSANYVTDATKLSNVFNSWILNMVGEIAAPVFDGGNRKAQQLQKKALADERYHAYREVVLNAVIEVENALIRNIYQDEKLVALIKQLDASRKTLEQAQIGYANGKSNYINVLNSLNNTQSLEQQIARAKLQQAKERVGLYRALGGRHWAKDIYQ